MPPAERTVSRTCEERGVAGGNVRACLSQRGYDGRLRNPLRLAEVALVCATAIYVAAFLVQQAVGLSSPMVMEYDARTYFMGALRYHGTGLFAGDPIADLSRTIGPYGWDALCWTWTLFADPIWMSKLVPFFVFAATCAFVFALGRRLGGIGLGCAFVIALSHTSFVYGTMAGAVPRGFGMVTVFAWLFFASNGRQRGAWVALGAAALLYLPAFLVLAAAQGLLVARRPLSRAALISAAVIAAGALAYLPKAIANAREFGSNPSYAEALERPDLGPHGCSHAVPLPPFWEVPAGHAMLPFQPTGPAWLPALAAAGRRAGGWGPAILLALPVGLALWRGPRSLATLVPGPLLLLVAGGLSVYLLARLVAFRLHYPDRYSLYSVLPAAVLALPIALAAAARGWLSNRAAGVVAAVGSATVLLLGYGSGLPAGIQLVDSRQAAPDVIRVLAATPPGSTIAAPLRLAEVIPLATHRRVWLKEAAINTLPGGQRWLSQLDQRIRAQFSAYYAADLAEVRDFAQREHVDILVVDLRDLGEQALARAHLFEPWGQWLHDRVAAAPGFALRAPPASAILYRRDPWVVLDLHRL